MACCSVMTAIWLAGNLKQGGKLVRKSLQLLQPDVDDYVEIVHLQEELQDSSLLKGAYLWKPNAAE